MRNVLLDVNFVVDIISKRMPFVLDAVKALAHARACGDKVWLYTGSVQTLEYTAAREIKRIVALTGQNLTFKEALKKAREKLQIFTSDVNWLAALAEDGLVFDEVEPEDAQLVLAVRRLSPDALLLTRDQKLIGECQQAISPNEYLLLQPGKDSIAFVDLDAQQDILRPQLETNIHKVMRHGQYIMGPEVQELEGKLAEFAGAEYCIGVANGTDALLMPLMALGIGPGDLVLTTPFTFIATAEVISLLGATPVFVDIDERTYNIDPQQIELAIQAIQTGNTEHYPLPAAVKKNPEAFTIKAIIPVDLFGLPADYDPIMAVAGKHDLFVLADSAQGFGGVYRGRFTGSLAHATTTSFFPAKPLGCYGDGGAIFTDDASLADKLTSIRVHGKGEDKYDNLRIGLNARLDTMQAAILLPKLESFPSELKHRRRIAASYTEGLANCNSIITPFTPECCQSAWAQYSIVAGNREKIQKSLKKSGVPTAIYYGRSLHLQPAFKSLGYVEGDMPISERISGSIFSLPMHPYLTEKAVCGVVDAIYNCFL